MIICLAGTKGGSGRSTTATNFACIVAGQGADVLLVDADDQETAADFTAARKQDHPEAAKFTCTKLTGRAVRTEVLELAPKYDHVIIDTGGRDTASQRAALSVSDVLVIPFAPRSFDIWTVNKVADLVEEMRAVNPKLKALAFNISRRSSRRPESIRTRCQSRIGRDRAHRTIPERQGGRRNDEVSSTLF